MSEHAASLAGLPRGRIDDVAALLSGVELFDGLAESDLAGIASLFKRVGLPPGELLWRQATPHDGLYFLLEGEVQVCRQLPGERELELARLGNGEVMGEIPLLGGAANHSASVRAIDRCTLLCLRRAESEAQAPEHRTHREGDRRCPAPRVSALRRSARSQARDPGHLRRRRHHRQRAQRLTDPREWGALRRPPRAQVVEALRARSRGA